MLCVCIGVCSLVWLHAVDYKLYLLILRWIVEELACGWNAREELGRVLICDPSETFLSGEKKCLNCSQIVKSFCIFMVHSFALSSIFEGSFDESENYVPNNSFIEFTCAQFDLLRNQIMFRAFIYFNPHFFGHFVQIDAESLLIFICIFVMFFTYCICFRLVWNDLLIGFKIQSSNTTKSRLDTHRAWAKAQSSFGSWKRVYYG